MLATEMGPKRESILFFYGDSVGVRKSSFRVPLVPGPSIWSRTVAHVGRRSWSSGDPGVGGIADG